MVSARSFVGVPVITIEDLRWRKSILHKISAQTLPDGWKQERRTAQNDAAKRLLRALAVCFLRSRSDFISSILLETEGEYNAFTQRGLAHSGWRSRPMPKSRNASSGFVPASHNARHLPLGLHRLTVDEVIEHLESVAITAALHLRPCQSQRQTGVSWSLLHYLGGLRVQPLVMYSVCHMGQTLSSQRRFAAMCN